MAEEQSSTEKRTAREITTKVDKDAPTLSLQPRNFSELWDFAKMISDTDFVPKAIFGKPGAVIAAIQYGNEVGLPPMTSLRWITVINGIPSIWGDAYWMLVTTHPLCEWFDEVPPHETVAKGYGECSIKRKDRKELITRRYTIEMATKAGLWGGKGSSQEKKEYSPWFTNPGRMLQMRARALCGRDAIPQATGPLSMREESEDYEAIETTGTAVKEEPLKIPQAITEQPPSQPEAQAKGESQVEDTGLPVGGDKKNVNDGQKPTEQKKLTPAEIKADILDWLENRATPEEILSNKNYLTMRMTKASGLSQQDQIEIVKAWNAKRKTKAPGARPV